MYGDNQQPTVKLSYFCFVVMTFVVRSVNFKFVLKLVVLVSSNSIGLDHQIHLGGGCILHAEVYYKSISWHFNIVGSVW